MVVSSPYNNNCSYNGASTTSKILRRYLQQEENNSGHATASSATTVTSPIRYVDGLSWRSTTTTTTTTTGTTTKLHRYNNIVARIIFRQKFLVGILLCLVVMEMIYYFITLKTLDNDFDFHHPKWELSSHPFLRRINRNTNRNVLPPPFPSSPQLEEGGGRQNGLVAWQQQQQLQQLQTNASSSSSSTNNNINGGSDSQKHQEQQSHQLQQQLLPPIDNYFSRKHIRVESNGEDDDDASEQQKSILIIGGSDGSGTRAFVKILQELNVPNIVIDNMGTMDVDGYEMYNGLGWPPLVQSILNVTHTANYNPITDIPQTIRNIALSELSKLIISLSLRSQSQQQQQRKNQEMIIRNQQKRQQQLQQDIQNQQKRQQKQRLVKKQDSHNASSGTTTMASYISFAFKAPVSMLLLPLIRQQLFALSNNSNTTSTATTNSTTTILPAMTKRLKFLHIIRDGRDVALSENHSPVDKFYTSFYKDSDSSSSRTTKLLFQQQEEEGGGGKGEGVGIEGSEGIIPNIFEIQRRHRIKAMQLWNDWNVQVHEYCKNNVDDGVTFDYLVMRTEDLLSNRYDSILRLADFVGANKSQQELCCLSKQRPRDMGKSRLTMKLDLLGNNNNEVEDSNNNNDFSESNNNNAMLKTKRRFDAMLALQREAGEKKQRVSNKRNMLQIKKNKRRRRMLLEEDVVNVNDAQRRTTIHEPWKERRQPKHGSLRLPEVYQETTKFQKNKSGWTNVGSVNKQVQLERLRGSSRGRLPLEGSQRVTERYGKWVEVLKSDPELSKRLHEEGAAALSLFGYEPFRHFMDIVRPTDFDCNDQVQCPT